MSILRSVLAAAMTAGLAASWWPVAPAMASGGAADCPCCVPGTMPAGATCGSCAAPAGQSGQRPAPAKDPGRCGCVLAPAATAPEAVVLVVPVSFLPIVPPSQARAPLDAGFDLLRPPIA